MAIVQSHIVFDDTDKILFPRTLSPDLESGKTSLYYLLNQRRACHEEVGDRKEETGDDEDEDVCMPPVWGCEDVHEV